VLLPPTIRRGSFLCLVLICVSMPTMSLYGQASPMTIITINPLVDALVGSPYSTTLTAVGGMPPYSWGLASVLPDGLSLSPNGTISGTPTGNYNGYPGNFTVVVYDSNRQDFPAGQKFDLDLYSPPQGCPTQPVQPDSCGGTATIYGPYPNQGAAGTQQTLSIFSSCFGYYAWDSVALSLPAGFTEVGSPTITWNGFNAATITAVVNIADNAAVGANNISAVLSGNGCQWPTNSVEYHVTPFCPSSLSIGRTYQERLQPPIFPTYKTGIGIAVVMQAKPDSTNWNGVQVSETLYTLFNTCPPQMHGGNFCGGSSTFIIGTNGDGKLWNGQPVSPVSNAFYDQHMTNDLASDLDQYGVPACSAACNQWYTCGGSALGVFQIRRDFTKDTIQGTPVTRVTVAKTQYTQ